MTNKRQVILEVSGGVVDVTEFPDDIEIIIIDHDLETLEQYEAEETNHD